MNYYYYNWQGTFSSTAVQSAIALSGGGLVRWLPAILVLGWWGGLFYLMWQLCVMLRFQLPRLSALALATLMLYTILQGTPTVFQSIYWTSGSVTYALPMMLFTLWCSVVLHVIHRSLPLSFSLVIGIPVAIGAGLLAGFSPIFAVFEVGLLGLLLVAIWAKRPNLFQSANLFILMSLVGAIIGTVIMIAAPGNSVRQAMFEKPHGLLALIGVNLVSTGSYIGIDLSAFSLVPHLVLLIIGGWVVNRSLNGSSIYMQVKRHPRIWLASALGIAIVLLFGIFLPTSYNISGFPPGRALIIPHVVMVALVLTWGSVMALSLRKSSVIPARVSPVLALVIVILLAIGPLWATVNSVSLSPKLQTFAAEWDARDALIQQSRNENQQVSVPPFSVDLADYVNVGSVEGEFVSCLQAYYHIQQLVVQK